MAINVVIYARYSSHGQNEQSIEGQVEECQRYCDLHDFNVIHIYADKALSGRDAEHRPQFMQMIQDAKSKTFSYVVVWKLDRFARNRVDSVVFKRELMKYGVRVLSATQNLDLSNEGIFYEAVLEANDEYYSANLGSNIRRGQKQSSEKGLFNGGICPYGYKINKVPAGNRFESHVVIDEETAPVVQMIFEMYADGIPKRKILQTLHDKGYRNPRGQDFKLSFFNALLHNKKYTGTYYFGSNGVENSNTYPQIISQELFDRVQLVIKARAIEGSGGHPKADYLLTGKIYCGECGARMIGTSGHGRHGEPHYYYSCAKRYHDHDCPKENEGKYFLEWWIALQTVNYVLQPDRMAFIADNLMTELNKRTNQSEISSLQAKIDELDKNITQLVKAIAEFRGDDDSLLAPVKSAYRENVQLKNGYTLELCRAKALNKANITKRDLIVALQQFCSGDTMDAKFQRRIIDAAVNCVYLYDDKVVIYYNSDVAPNGATISSFDNALIITNIEDNSEDAEDGSTANIIKLNDYTPNPPYIKTSSCAGSSTGFTGGTEQSLYEPKAVYYVFINGFFGLVLYR